MTIYQKREAGVAPVGTDWFVVEYRMTTPFGQFLAQASANDNWQLVVPETPDVDGVYPYRRAMLFIHTPHVLERMTGFVVVKRRDSYDPIILS